MSNKDWMNEWSIIDDRVDLITRLYKFLGHVSLLLYGTPFWNPGYANVREFLTDRHTHTATYTYSTRAQRMYVANYRTEASFKACCLPHGPLFTSFVRRLVDRRRCTVNIGGCFLVCMFFVTKWSIDRAWIIVSRQDWRAGDYCLVQTVN